MPEGSYLGLCFRARALDLRVKLSVQPAKDPSKDPSRLSRLWVEDSNGDEQATAFLFKKTESLDDAAEVVLEQLKREPA